MSTYDLSISDFEEFNTLIRITNTINNLYEKLYALEIYNQKDSDEYQKKLTNLSIAIEVENEKYEELDLTCERCLAFLQYLHEYKLPKDFSSNISSIINEDYKNSTFRRIQNVISRKINLLYGDVLVPEEILTRMQTIAELDDTPDANLQAKWNFQTTEGSFMDVYNFYMYFLNQGIKNPKYEELKDRLLASKYYMAMIDKEIEKNLLEGNFDILPPFYYYSEYQQNLHNIPMPLFLGQKNNIVQELIISSIENLLLINVKKGENFKNKIAQLFLSYILRSALILVDPNVKESLIFSFNELLKDEDFKKNFDVSSKNIKFIKNVFLNTEIDKSNIEKSMIDYNPNNK